MNEDGRHEITGGDVIYMDDGEDRPVAPKPVVIPCQAGQERSLAFRQTEWPNWDGDASFSSVFPVLFGLSQSAPVRHPIGSQVRCLPFAHLHQAAEQVPLKYRGVPSRFAATKNPLQYPETKWPVHTYMCVTLWPLAKLGNGHPSGKHLAFRQGEISICRGSGSQSGVLHWPC